MSEENENNELSRNAGEKQWSFRRKLIANVVIYCCLMIAAITVWTMVYPVQPVEIFSTIVSGCFALIGAVIGYYVGGAVLQDTKGK